MTATQGDLAALSRFVFRAPRWDVSVGFALLLAAVTGIGVFETPFVLGDAWEGVFFVGIPTVVAALGTAALDRWRGGRLTRNRSSLLALACEVGIVALLTVAAVIALLTRLGQNFVFDALIFGLAAIFAVRLLVVVAVSRGSILTATVPAMLQTATAAVLLFVYSGTMRYLEVGGPLVRAYLSRPNAAPAELLVVTPTDFLHLGVLCALHGAAAVGFIAAMDRPWRRSLGVSALDFLAGFVGHIAEDSRELENFFEAIGEEAVVPVTVCSFRTCEDGDANSADGEGAERPADPSDGVVGAVAEPLPEDALGPEKARIVLPMVHPGPMGTIGGGDLPMRVAESTAALAFPPHATAGHDFNLVTDDELDALLDAASRAADRIRYRPLATPSVQPTVGEATVTGQAFGDGLVLAGTFAPGCADDVDYAVGLAAMAEARSAGFDDVLLADAHNSNDGLTGQDLGHVTPGSERSFDLIAACERAARQCATADAAPPALGVAWDATDWTPADGIGPLGIRVAVIEVAGETTAYVLIDGNNMEPGLRSAIRDGIDRVDRLEVLTTDTHVVTQVDAVNQVGDVIPWGDLVVTIDDLVGSALADREPVAAGMATERATVTVFGNDRTETLASHANAAVTMGGAIAATVVLAVASLSAVVFLLA